MIPSNKDQLTGAAKDFLKTQELAVIATATLNGQPEAATIGFFLDADFNFYFLSKASSRKVKNISANPLVALVIGTTAGTKTIQTEGEAKIIKPGENTFQDLLLKVSQIKPLYYGPLLKTEGIDFVIVKVKTTWLRYSDINDLTGKEEYFQIIP